MEENKKLDNNFEKNEETEEKESCLTYLLRTCTDFNGRISWKGYLVWNIFIFIVLTIVGIIGYMITQNPNTILGITLILGLLLLVPNLSITVRRFHDLGKSGLSVLFFLIPIVNWIIMFILFLPGKKEPNNYGNPPEIC